MKRLFFLVLPLALSLPLFAAEVDSRLERALRSALPVCADATVTYEPLAVKLPPRFTGTFVKVESPRHSCDAETAAILSPSGGFYLGSPWLIADEAGSTIEEKLRSFTGRNLQEYMTATVERTTNEDGLFPVTLLQTTEAGKVPMHGFVDPDGRLFFFGQFRRGDVRAARAKAFETLLATAPAKGPASANVTIVEFSDFQCPSCMRSAGFVDPIVEKHGDKIRYVRYDLPLDGHAWAFPASLAGRAIYRQSPDVFWTYKKQVYENQGKLNAFTFWDWARAFAEDHDLDLARYDADLAAEPLRMELLKGVGTAFSNDVRGTPTYMVNGAFVEAGDDGKALAAYVDSLLAE